MLPHSLYDARFKGDLYSFPYAIKRMALSLHNMWQIWVWKENQKLILDTLYLKYVLDTLLRFHRLLGYMSLQFRRNFIARILNLKVVNI